MSAERSRQVEQLYHAARERDPAQRAVFLDQACAGDQALRHEVDSLLAEDASVESFLETPALDFVPTISGEDAGQSLIGRRLGSYQCVSLLGKGGMGEVYRARDTQLHRDVALKLLPSVFASDPERLARFQREAEVLASLNHPSIAQIYGLEGTGRSRCIVMELVEGETLEERLKRGPIPVDEALLTTKQIAEALEAAHERDIIHRDLKPANVKITPEGRVKVLDFGLAKPLEEPGSDLSNTDAGVVLGTAAYMSPEQARGKKVDKRADIWAFGCVLYELLTGKQAFDGETVTETLAAVLKADPDWTMLPAATPAGIRVLLRRCLQKDLTRRLRDATDARIEIEDALSGAQSVPVDEGRLVGRKPWWKRAIPALLTGVALSVVTGFLVWNFRPSVPPATIRFSFTIPGDQRFSIPGRSLIAISPDGTQMVYAANSRLYIRSMSEVESKPISGTENTQGGVSNPIFSPDGRYVAFWSGSSNPPIGTLKKIAVGGGSPVTLSEVAANPLLGVSWDKDRIVFGRGSDGILRVSENGGKPETLVRVKADEVAANPQQLPGAQAVLFTLAPATGRDRWNKARIVVQSLKSGERKTLIEGGSDARYVPTGHIVYALSGRLFAIPFDVKSLEVIGTPVPIIEGVQRAPGGAGSGDAQFSFSNTGSLIYLPGPLSAYVFQWELALFDRQGAATPLKIPPAEIYFPRVSPDGKRVAFEIDDGQDANISIYDLSGTSPVRRLTFGGRNRFPIWSADGERIAFQSDREGDLGIFWQRTDGTSPAERLTKPEKDTAHIPESWAPKRDSFLFRAVNGYSVTLWTFSVRDKKAAPFEAVQSSPTNAVFSPDGQWLAYQSRETSGFDLFVEPFPSTGAKYQVPGKPGKLHPVWSADGKELFYDALVPGELNREFFGIRVTTRPGFTFGNPVPLAKVTGGGSIPGLPESRDSTNYGVTPNGQFIAQYNPGNRIPELEAGGPASQIQIVLNWFEELKRRVPVR